MYGIGGKVAIQFDTDVHRYIHPSALLYHKKTTCCQGDGDRGILQMGPFNIVILHCLLEDITIKGLGVLIQYSQ